METIQKLFDSWDEGGEENYPHSVRRPATDAEISMFESRHGVVLPAPAKEFYRRVNGMTLGEFERDTNHFRVKFFPLQQVTACGHHPVDTEGLFFAIATVGHHDPGPKGYQLVYGLELFRDHRLSNRVFGIYSGSQVWFEIANSLEEFFEIAATRSTDDAILDPEHARGIEALRARGTGPRAAIPRKRSWWPWKA